jgi:flagellar motor switch protein FliM
MSAPTQTTESSAPIPALVEDREATAAVPAGLKGLRQSGLVPEVALRKLRALQEDFARSLSARLSIYLRLDFSVTLAGLQTISFQKFIERADTPLHLMLAKFDPLHGIGVLEISPPLAASLVDRQLGGSGKTEEADRALTDIETALLDQVIEMVLSEWCLSWRALQELKPSLLGHEIDTRFLNAIPRETLMLEVTFEAAMNDCRKRFRIGLPYASLEMLIRRLDGSSESQAAMPAPTPVVTARWNSHFDDVPVTLSAVCDGLELTARALANLKAGDTLTLDPQQFNQVHVRIGAIPTFLGSPGTSEGRWAVQVIRKLEA